VFRGWKLELYAQPCPPFPAAVFTWDRYSPPGRSQQDAVQVRAILIPGALCSTVLPAEGAAAGTDNSHSGNIFKGQGRAVD